MQRGNPNPSTPANHIKPRLIQESLEEVSLSLQKQRNILLWHDPTITSPHNQKMHSFLSYITEVKGFDDPDKLIQFITDSKPANYTVLTAGTKGEILTKGVSDLLNVSAVYVFCGNVAYHSTWAAQYPKVAHVESDPTRLIMKIFADLRKRVAGHGSLKIDLPVFLEDFGFEGEREFKLRNSQLNRITDMEDRILAQKDLIYLGKHACGEGEEKEIERFENEYMEYDAAKILKWYTESEIIARLASNCLKQGIPDALYFGRYLLKDLGKAINESYWKKSQEFKGNVYRNIFITEEQWKILKGNEGKEMVFVDFLRATKVKEEAQKYLKIGIDTNILVTIQVEGPTKEPRKGFAELLDTPQDVVFSAFTRFTIRGVSSKDVNGKDEDRELVLGFGFGAEQLNPLVQEGITFAQCMNCQAVLETGVDEVINLAMHYTCDKCPKEHAAPVVVVEKKEEEIPKLVELKEENEGKARQRVQQAEPNHSLLSKEIDIKNMAPVESVFLVPGIDKAFPSIHQKKEDNLEKAFPAIYKKEEEEAFPSIHKKEAVENIPVIEAKVIEKERGKVKEEVTKEEEEKLFEKLSKLEEQKEKEKVKEEVPVVVKKAAVEEDDDEEEEEEEEEEDEEDEEQGRMLELYLKAKEEFENKNYREAIKWYEEILKNPGKLDKILLGKCSQNLNASYAALGEEVDFLLKVLNEKKQSLGKNHAEVKATYKELAHLFAKLAVE